MYLRMIRKDLKRKRTMNTILLLFVMLSAMFTASSINNIVAVADGLDHYFDEAGMADYYIVAHTNGDRDSVEELIAGSENVDTYRKDNVIYTTAENFTQDGKKIIDYSDISMVQSLADTDFRFFDSDNNTVSEVEAGKMYITGAVAQKSYLYGNS